MGAMSEPRGALLDGGAVLVAEGPPPCSAMDMSLSKLRELVMVREDWRAVVHGITESDMTEQLN